MNSPLNQPNPTRVQGQVLIYLHVFLQVNHQLPPCKKIAQDFGWASPNAAYEMVQALERNGFMQRNEIGNHMISPQGMSWVAGASQEGARQ